MKHFPKEFDEYVEDDDGVKPRTDVYFVPDGAGIVHAARCFGIRPQEDKRKLIEFMTIGEQCLVYFTWKHVLFKQQRQPTCLSCIVAMEGT